MTLTDTPTRPEPAIATASAALPDLQQQVEQLATDHGWQIHHARGVRRSQTGFPGLVLVRGGRSLWRVLTTSAADLTSEQHDWLYALTKTNADAAVWRPADLHNGTIRAQLTKEPQA